ncbi:MAG: hypothetical protein MI810_07525 [Flavobacteriales bacterium]|nr:hypothetical protein [Flavobacteriales bacterium]
MKTSFIGFLISIALFVQGCKDSNPQQSLPHTSTKYFLDDFIADSIDQSFYDTSGTVYNQSFIDNMSLLPNEFGKLIMEDIIEPLEDQKFVCWDKDVDSIVEIGGWKTTPRFNPYEDFSNDSYLIFISFHSLKDEVNWGECILLDFEKSLIETWYWPSHLDSSFQFIQFGNEFPAVDLNYTYSDIVLDSTSIDFAEFEEQLDNFRGS